MTVGATDGGKDQLPYVGLRPYRREDDWRFAGRDTEITEITTRWRASRVTVLSGPPGAGKTSLLQAGVLPRLGLLRVQALPVGRPARISAFPIAALPEQHNPYTLAVLSGWSPADSATRLASLTLRDFLRGIPLRADGDGTPQPVFAAIDQAEKLFLDPTRPASTLRAFFDELAEALADQPRLRLLLSIRDDALGDLRLFHHDLGDPAVYALESLALDAAVLAARQPAERAGYAFSPGVAEELVSNISGDEPAGLTKQPDGGDAAYPGDVEPALLQAVCAGLWAALPGQERVIGFGLLRQYGNVPRLLTDFCLRAVRTVADEHRVPVTGLLSWLGRNFITEAGTRGTVAEGKAETAGMPNAIARALEDWHVLRAFRRTGQRWYELQHDCLVGPVRQASLEPGGAGRAAPSTPAEQLRAAEVALADGELALAERLAADAARSTADTDLRLRAEAESLLGNVAHARSQPAKAETRYRHAAALFEALQDTSAVAGLLAAIGQTLLAQGRAAEAVDKLQAAIRRIPNDLTVQTELGRALWLQGQHAAAVAVLTGVLTMDGHAPNALRARGEILADLGEAEKALRDLDRVRRPRRPTVQAARALALATLRRRSAADEEIGAALSDAPDNGQVLLYAARVGELGGDRTMAADLARRAEAADNPALPPHQLAQARRLQRLGEATVGNAH